MGDVRDDKECEGNGGERGQELAAAGQQAFSFGNIFQLKYTLSSLNWLLWN